MSIVFFGTPRFSIRSLEALTGAGERIEAAVTRPDKPVGRKRVLTPTPLKEAALRLGIRVLTPGSMKDEGFAVELRAIRPEFIVVVAFGRILTREVLEIPRRGTVNVHASMLPRWRGASPVAHAIIHGDAETGVTTMLMNEGLDEGDVLMMQKTAITDEDTLGSLEERLSKVGAALLVRTLKGMRDGSLKPSPQSGEPTFAPPLKREDGRVDWSRPARDIFNLIRGTHPWPGAYCHMGGTRVKLIKAAPADEGGGPGAPGGLGGPGEIVGASAQGIKVGTGEGILEIRELQPEGKRPMAAGAFLAGRRLGAGDAFDA